MKKYFGKVNAFIVFFNQIGGLSKLLISQLFKAKYFQCIANEEAKLEFYVYNLNKNTFCQLNDWSLL